MPWLPRVSVSLLLALALVALAGPAAAHVSDIGARGGGRRDGPGRRGRPGLERRAHIARAVLDLPAALALGVLTAWYRPRRAVAVTLALLLCVFAFENALHSVHHGFDQQQQEACTVAAASAHLAAVEVDDPGLSSIALLVVGRAEADPPASVPTRFLSPDQGRAPPSAIL